MLNTLLKYANNYMDKQENRGAKPGENRGKGNQGRKPFERKLKAVTVRVFEDQCPVTSKYVRELIDTDKKKQGQP